MKASDFNLAEELKLNIDTGIAMFRDSRMVIMDSGALGLLRQNLVKELGVDRARTFFLRFGYTAGYMDFMQIKSKYDFDTELDLLAAGPVLHTWEGVVKVIPNELRFDRKAKTFYFTGRWTNSYEAEQYLSFNETGTDPVCWSLVGYASGWGSAFFGSPLIAVETSCVGKGDRECAWLVRPPSACGPEAKDIIEALSTLLSG